MKYERIINGVTERFEGTLEEITALMIRLPMTVDGTWRYKGNPPTKAEKQNIMDMISKELSKTARL